MGSGRLRRRCSTRPGCPTRWSSTCRPGRPGPSWADPPDRARRCRGRDAGTRRRAGGRDGGRDRARRSCPTVSSTLDGAPAPAGRGRLGDRRPRPGDRRSCAASDPSPTRRSTVSSGRPPGSAPRDRRRPGRPSAVGRPPRTLDRGPAGGDPRPSGRGLGRALCDDRPSDRVPSRGSRPDPGAARRGRSRLPAWVRSARAAVLVGDPAVAAGGKAVGAGSRPVLVLVVDRRRRGTIRVMIDHSRSSSGRPRTADAERIAALFTDEGYPAATSTIADRIERFTGGERPGPRGRGRRRDPRLRGRPRHAPVRARRHDRPGARPRRRRRRARSRASATT